MNDEELLRQLERRAPRPGADWARRELLPTVSAAMRERDTGAIRTDRVRRSGLHPDDTATTLAQPSPFGGRNFGGLLGVAGAVGAAALFAVLLALMFTRPDTSGIASPPAISSPVPGPTDSQTAQPTDAQTPQPTVDPAARVRAQTITESSVGSFELTLEADRGTYTEGDEIGLEAMLRYLGPDERVSVSAGASLFGSFSFRQLDGDLEMSRFEGPAPCPAYELRRDEPIQSEGPTTAGLFYEQDDPDADFYRRWSQSPYLWLPAGAWEVSIGAGFALGPEGCGDDQVGLSTSVTITVLDPDPEPTPTVAPDPPVQHIDRARAETSVGAFELTLQAGRAQYIAGETIDLWSELRYRGDIDVVELSGYALVTGVSYTQLDGPLEMLTVMPLPCGPLEMRRDEPERRPAGKGGAYSSDDPNAEFYRQWMDDPRVWLPAGVWQVSVGTGFVVGPGCSGEDVNLSASIVIRVVEPDPEPGPEPTPTPAAGEPVPFDLPTTEFRCDYARPPARDAEVSLVDRAGVATGCVAHLRPNWSGPPAVSNPADDQRSLSVTWPVSQCDSLPATVTLWPNEEYGDPLIIVVERPATSASATACLYVVIDQEVVIALNDPIAARGVALIYLDGDQPGAAAETAVGTFRLSLQADGESAVAGQPIGITATLAYAGPHNRVTLTGSPGDAIGFIYTQLDGPLVMEGGSATVCEGEWRLSKDRPIEHTAREFVGFDGDGPYTDWYHAWAQSDELWFPSGTWLIQAAANFHVGPDCAGDPVILIDSLIIEVE
jgi:hypothetical protein